MTKHPTYNYRYSYGYVLWSSPFWPKITNETATETHNQAESVVHVSFTLSGYTFSQSLPAFQGHDSQRGSPKHYQLRAATTITKPQEQITQANKQTPVLKSYLFILVMSLWAGRDNKAKETTTETQSGNAICYCTFSRPLPVISV